LVRSVADRAFLPTKNLLEEVGDMMILTGKTIVSALRPPYPYGGEFVGQFLFALRLCWFPLLISTVAFGYGAPGLQAANFLVLFGALDRLGGFFVLASIREFAPFVTAIVLAGVAGTAITADLGARKIREELDALQVLGVDPVKNLVVPRFLALMVVTGYGMMQEMAASNTILQTIVPEDKRGRVMSFYSMAFAGTAPFGSLGAGYVAQRIGAPTTLIIGGLACVLGAVWFTTQLQRIRELVRPIYVQLGILPEVATGIQAAASVMQETER